MKVKILEEIIDVRVAENGHMVLPRVIRDALGLHGEAKIILTLDDKGVRLTSLGHGVRRAQELYKKHMLNDRDTTAFLKDRHDEARTCRADCPSNSQRTASGYPPAP